MPLTLSDNEEEAAYGAALCAGVSVGFYPNVHEAVKGIPFKEKGN